MLSTLLFKKNYKNISPNDARGRLKSDKKIVLLDVRTPEEYAQLHIPNSKLLPLDHLESGISKIISDKDTELFVYCQSGARASAACNILTKIGYTNVNNLGGIISWPYDTEKGI